MSEEALVALEDLTNGALNYYKTTETVMIRKRIIEDYIKKIQQKNQQLKNDNAVMKAGLIQIRDEKINLYKSVIDEVNEFVKAFQSEFDNSDDVFKDMNKLLEILNKANIKESE